MTIGDFDPSAVVYFKFTTQQPSTGAPFTLAGTPALSVYKDNSVTQSTSGVTLTADFDSVTGLNHVAIDTSADGTFYAAGSFFDVVITTGTVDSISAVGFVVGRFSLRKTAGLKPATAGRTLVVDAAGLADANMVKAGPTGSGTAQTARDLGASVLLSAGTGAGQLDFTSGVVKANLAQILGTALTETAGQIAAAFKKFFNVGTPASTMDHLMLIDTATSLTNAPSDSSGVTTLLGRLTSARGGYLDNLNVGGAVASHADIAALNTSASKHLILTTVQMFERPESGTTVYTVEARTFTASDGSAVNADTTPTLTATGQTSGSLSANLSAANNPATGLYRWTYTVSSTDAAEPIRFDLSATIASATFTLSAFSQVLDEVSATFTSTDKSNLTAVFNKLPTNNIADETVLTGLIGAPVVDLSTDIAGVLAKTPDAAHYTNARGDKLDDLDATVSSRLPASSYAAPPTAAANAGAVWDEAMAGHVAAGSAGADLAAASGGADPATIADAVWDEATAGHQTTGTTGKALTSASSAGDPWTSELETGYTAADIMRILAAVAAGKDTVVKTGSGSATVTFRSIDDSADRVVGQMSASRRVAVTLTP